MKSLLSLSLSLLLAIPARAEVVNDMDPVETYWQWSQAEHGDTDSDAVDLCLEKIYGANENLGICQKAISDLTTLPLNPHRREILISLLKKIPETQRSPQQSELIKGLLQTHPALANEGIPTSLPVKKHQVLVSAPETKAWLKVLSQKTKLTKAWISLNGQALTLAAHFSFPIGTYQWTLVTADLEPLVIVGTWADFSNELKNLKPQTDVSQWLPPKKVWKPAENLVDLPSTPVDESVTKSSSHSWIIPVVIAVGVGLAFALKDKQVTVKMPGQN
jgi:hypothetical protein